MRNRAAAKSAVAQARFGEVTVERACPDHEPELIEFINQYISGLRNLDWSPNQ